MAGASRLMNLSGISLTEKFGPANEASTVKQVIDPILKEIPGATSCKTVDQF